MGGFLERIIAQGTMLSAMKAATFTTTKKNQGEAIVRVFEGVRPFTKDGNLLGTLTLNGNPSSAGANVEVKHALFCSAS
jgi:molecular chaperone DnaK (HSP70)